MSVSSVRSRVTPRGAHRWVLYVIMVWIIEAPSDWTNICPLLSSAALKSGVLKASAKHDLCFGDGLSFPVAHDYP